jgi:hypothetical protein
MEIYYRLDSLRNLLFEVIKEENILLLYIVHHWSEQSACPSGANLGRPLFLMFFFSCFLDAKHLYEALMSFCLSVFLSVCVHFLRTSLLNSAQLCSMLLNICTKSAQNLRKICTNYAQILHKICTNLHKICTNDAKI